MFGIKYVYNRVSIDEILLVLIFVEKLCMVKYQKAVKGVLTLVPGISVLHSPEI